MEIAIIVFICIVGVMTVFSIVVTTIDLIRGRKEANNPKQPQIIIQQVPMQMADPNSQTVVQKVEEPKKEVEGQYVDENSIVISPTASKTLDEKYKELPKKFRKFYDEISSYAANKEGIKHFKNNRYEEYKVGINKVVRLLIKRGVVVTEFFFINQDVKELATDSKIKVKQASTSIKVEDTSSLEFVKGSIDIAYDQILEHIERKKQARRQARKNKQ